MSNTKKIAQKFLKVFAVEGYSPGEFGEGSMYGGLESPEMRVTIDGPQSGQTEVFELRDMGDGSFSIQKGSRHLDDVTGIAQATLDLTRHVGAYLMDEHGGMAKQRPEPEGVPEMELEASRIANKFVQILKAA